MLDAANPLQVLFHFFFATIQKPRQKQKREQWKGVRGTHLSGFDYKLISMILNPPKSQINRWGGGLGGWTQEASERVRGEKERRGETVWDWRQTWRQINALVFRACLEAEPVHGTAQPVVVRQLLNWTCRERGGGGMKWCSWINPFFFFFFISSSFCYSVPPNLSVHESNKLTDCSHCGTLVVDIFGTHITDHPWCHFLWEGSTEKVISEGQVAQRQGHWRSSELHGH